MRHSEMQPRHFAVALITFALSALAEPALAEPLVVAPAPVFTAPPVPSLDAVPQRSFRGDVAAWPSRLWEDARALPSWENAQVLSLGGGWAIVAAEGFDRGIRRGVARNERRMGQANDLFSVSGHPLMHIGVAGLVYGGSFAADDRRLHAFSLDLFNAFVLTDVSSQTLKYAFDSDRPNGERFGFPSGHAASSFAFASVVQSHYGLVPGLAAYALAAGVGWHRVDARKHELSDVLGGAVIGYVIGKSVTADDTFQKGNIRIVPYSDPYEGGVGIGLAWSF
ncbi:MAG: phosphatase PAP2 family protein [Candidatus Binatia bacterium]